MQDARFGVRVLAKNPGFTIIAILTLALGIGANTAIFSILNQILLRRLPVRNPDELVMLTSPGPKHGHVWSDGDDSEIFSFPLYKGLAKNTSVFNGVICRYVFSASIASRGQTDRASGELVSGNYFDVLGVRPILGRLLSPADDDVQGAHPVLAVSYGYWTKHFGSDPAVLNQTVLVNNTEMTIVGVAEAGFTGLQVGQTPDMFVPITMKSQMTPIRNGLDDWNDSFLAVFARRKPGVSIQQAESGINLEYPSLLELQAATLKGAVRISACVAYVPDHRFADHERTRLDDFLRTRPRSLSKGTRRRPGRLHAPFARRCSTLRTHPLESTPAESWAEYGKPADLFHPTPIEWL
jgi:hypothetical protein